MIEVRQTERFAKWLGELRDAKAKARIVIRIRRAELGNLGDVKFFDGIGEMRIPHGPGYRVYFAKRGEEIVILLCGGDKSSQRRDIAAALELAKEILGMAIETRPFDVAEYLDAPEMIAEYLVAAFEENDPVLMRAALNDIARAKGMTALERETGLKRETLYKALGEAGNPTLDTLTRLLRAFGVRLSVAPVMPEGAASA